MFQEQSSPKSISITDFSYNLPPDRIALYPLPDRDASKLLIYREGRISEDIYRNIHRYLPENSLLIFNNTKVVEARILFRKPTGGQIELFCLEPPAEQTGIAGNGHANITTAMAQQGQVRWKCLIGGASKWKPGQVLIKHLDTDPASGDKFPGRHQGVLEARFHARLEDSFLVEFSWFPENLSFAEVLHLAGSIPLPPYIKRTAEASDSERYQTVYALHKGSVAAPTAGLHFTDSLFQSLLNIQREFVTLHVGAGTFLPVKSATMEQHPMHAEFISVTLDLIRKLQLSGGVRENGAPGGGDWGGGPIIPVGTTSLRTIESLYWLGSKVYLNPDILPEDLVVRQWDAYEIDGSLSREKSLTALGDWMERHHLSRLVTQTQLLIVPGYKWKVASALVTNFHQPQSTLLLLVAALVGEDWKKIYQYALDNQFRFLSYGDGCLLFSGETPA